MTHLPLFLPPSLFPSLFLLCTEGMVDLMIVSETSSVNRENSVHTPAVEGSSERIVRLFSYHPLELIIIIIKYQPCTHTHTHTRTHTHAHTHGHTHTHTHTHPI